MDQPPIFDSFIDGPAKELLRLINNHALVYILSDDGILKYSNQKLADLSGFTVDELEGMSVLNLRSQYHPDSFYEEMWSILRQGGTWTGEICCMGRSGSYYWEELSICPLELKGDTNKYYLGVSADISLLKSREKTMEAYNEMLVNITKGMPLRENFVRLIHNVEAIFPHMNCAIMLSENENYLRSFAGPSIPDEYAEAVDGIEIGETVGSCGAAAKTQELVVVEDIYNHPNWAPYIDVIKDTGYRACWSHPIVSSEGKTYGTFAIYYRTTRGPTEIELTLIQSLAYSCRGAIESHNARYELIEQRNRAETANHAKSQFLANMSHELRTPLNAVLGFSEILEKELFGPLGNNKYKVYAGDIQTSAHFLLDIIGDILDISLIEAGKVSPEPENLPVKKLMGCCMQLVKNRANDKGVTYEIIEPEGDYYIYADKQHVKQIIANLLINAIKFTPSKGKVILTAEINKPEYIDFIIRDNGIGITNENLERVMEPFSQVADSMTRAHEGVGLGLSLAKKLAVAQGGDLRLESEYGEGTTVFVSLPLQY
ncbi:ATP-binding protein [Kiloniella majae]|uniref:PAS domain-containing sensor histidine kinase n=1 Tax=Kiloniella majae TaxID=1938558 RepID=UPI000A276EA5|nr:ATP-binding protein [Kiloniella majae]